MISRLVAAAMQGVPLTESELGEDNPEVNFPMLTTPAQFAEIVPGDLTNLIRSYTASCWTTLQGENLNLDDIPSKFQTVCHNRFIQGVEDALAYFIAKLMTDYLSTVLHQASMPTIGERESDLHHTGISASSAEAVGQNCSDTGDSDPRDFLARGLGLPRGSAAATVSKKRKATRKRQRDEMDIDSAWGSGAGSKAYSSSITGAVNSAASPKGSSEHTTSSKCSAEASSSDLAIKIRVFQFVERKIEEEIRLREKTGDPVEDEIARLQLLVNSVPGGP
ncbi:hypothetical protein DFJ73DRAFT_417456 [Zopfochytrium polystomum]|nr:hypothetical protein DFJ73DRAFT_417456 [Zopfochytrium polystomum]